MGEVIVVNLFLLVRVFLVGGIFIMFPRITRKGLFFGVYVGEEFQTVIWPEPFSELGSRLCDRDGSGPSGGVGGTLAGNAVAGNLTGTAVLLGLHVHFFRRMEGEGLGVPDVREQAGKATATIELGSPKGETFAKITLAICLLVSLATLTYAYVSYPSMGERMPTLWSLIGGAEGTTEISYLTIL